MGSRASQMIRTLAVALGLVVSLASRPADAVKIIGAGISSCGTWTAERTKNSVAAREDAQWVVGYLSAVGS